jgi:hypothetical protein
MNSVLQYLRSHVTRAEDQLQSLQQEPAHIGRHLHPFTPQYRPIAPSPRASHWGDQRCWDRLRTRSAKSRSSAISAIKARKTADPGTNQSSAVRRRNA